MADRIFDAREKREAIEREIAYRQRAYPRWIAAGKMKEADSRYQIGIMQAIADDYRKAEEKERLL